MAGIVLKSGGTIDNSTTISGYAYGVEIYGGTGTVVNSGYITASAAGGYGVILRDGGSVTNEFGGYIAGNTAVALLGGGSVTNDFGASIESSDQSGNAVAVSITGAAGTVSNSGLIGASSSSSTFAAVFLGDGGSVNNYVTGLIRAGAYETAISIQGVAGHVNNAGTILSGVYAVSLSAGGTLTNTGSIYGRVAISGSGGSVTNSGSIYDAGPPSGKGSGVGVTVGSGATVVNQAGGSIGGGGPKGVGVYFYGGGSIVNAGTIFGAKSAIEFAGSGANTLTLQSGSVLYGAVIGSTAQGATNALVLTGAGAANNAFVNFNSLTVNATGTWSLGGVQTIGETILSAGEFNVTGKLLTTLDEETGSVLTIGRSHRIKLYNASTLSGITVGMGTLAVNAGMTTLAAGAEFDVAHWTVLGSTAMMTLDEQMFYGGVFNAGSGATVTVSVGRLVLSGTSFFSGATLNGTQRVRDKGVTSVSGLDIGGTGGFTNKGVLTQTGAVVLGDEVGNTAQIYNAAPATWDITDDAGIALGASTASSIQSLGVFEKTSGSGVSIIAPAFQNFGSVVVSSGDLDFQGAFSSAGAQTIEGAATLEFDAALGNGVTISFTGNGGTLDLGAPAASSVVLEGFDSVGSNDAVELLGSWSIADYAQISASQGVLTLSTGAQAATLTFDGAYNPSLFAAATNSGHTTITYT